MSRRMPTRYSVLTRMRGVRRLAILVVAPLMALAVYGLQRLTGRPWPPDSVLEYLPVLIGLINLAGLMAIVAFSWLEPRLVALQVRRKLSRSGFASVTRVSWSADYPVGEAVFSAVDTTDDDQPVTIEASWCYQRLLITVSERKEDQ